LRKIAAVILGVLTVFSYGYTYLPKSLNLIGNWLSPILGASFYVLLSTIFLLFANPTTNLVLLGLWLGVGVLIGFLTRRKRAALASGILIFTILHLILGLSIVKVLLNITSLGFKLDPKLLPPFPQELSTTTILSAPVIGEIYPKIIDLISKGGFTGLPDLLNTIINVILKNWVLNLSILLASSIVFAHIFDMLTKRFLSKKTEVWRVRLAKFFVVFLCLATFSSIFGFTTVMATPPNTNYYAENLIGGVLPDGTAIASMIFFHDLNLTEFVSKEKPAFDQLVAAVLTTQKFQPNTLSRLLKGLNVSIPNLSTFTALIPDTLFIVVYNGTDQNLLELRADTVASLFSKRFSVSLTPIFSTSKRFGEGRGGLYVKVYQSFEPFSLVKDKVVKALPTNFGGLTSVMYLAYKNGRIIPEASPKSANGTVLWVGLIDFSSLPLERLGKTEAFEKIDPSKYLPRKTVWINGFFSYWVGYMHSSPKTHEFNPNELLGYNQSLPLSNQAVFSNIIVLTPTKTTPEKQPTINVSLITTLEIPKEAIPQNITLTKVSKGSVINPSIITSTFSYVFPAQLKVIKTVKLKDNNNVEITIRVLNKDDKPIINVVVDDSQALIPYKTSIEKTLTPIFKCEKIEGNSEKVFTYSVLAKNPGTYTFLPATVTYTSEGLEFSSSSNMAHVTLPKPSIFTLMVDGYLFVGSLFNYIPGFQNYGLTIFTLIVLGIIALIIFNEYRGLKKQVKTTSKRIEKT